MSTILKTLTICILVCFTLHGSAQTSEQAAGFLNRSQLAIFKTQKEMIRTGDMSLSSDFKKAIEFQAIAVKSFKSGNYKEAVDFSYFSRLKSISLLENLTKQSETYFQLTEEEKAFSKANDKLSLEAGRSKLSDSQLGKISGLDASDVQKLMEIEISIN